MANFHCFGCCSSKPVEERSAKFKHHCKSCAKKITAKLAKKKAAAKRVDADGLAKHVEVAINMKADYISVFG